MKMLLTALVLLLPVSAFAQSPPSPTPIRFVIGAAMVAHGADLATTAWAMGKSGDRYREANPLMRPFAGDPSLLAGVKMTVAVGINWGLLELYADRPKLAIGLGIAQTIAIGVVANRNARLLGLR